MTRANTMSGLVLLGLGLSGCFSLDASLIGDAGDEQSADSGDLEQGPHAGEDAAAGDIGDAGHGQSADSGDPEQGPHAGEDAAAGDGGAASSDAQLGDEGGPLVVECNEDAQCAQDEFCAGSTERRGNGRRFCEPRCSEKLGCLLGAIDRRVNDLAVVNGSLLILTQNTTDSLGNPRNDQEVLRWDRPAAPVTLARGACQYLVQLTQTHLFCLDAGTMLRVPLTEPTATPERLGGDGFYMMHWSTSTDLWWSVWQNTSVSELWRVALAGAQTPQRVSTDATRTWVAGSERDLYFFKFEADAADLFAQGTSLMDEPRKLGPFSRFFPSVVATADAVYFTDHYSSIIVKRLALNGGATTTLASLGACDGTFEVSGSHVYWQCYESAADVASGAYVMRIGRNTVAPPGEPQVLLQAPTGLSAPGFERSVAVLDHSLVYIHPDNERLFEVSF